MVSNFQGSKKILKQQIQKLHNTDADELLKSLNSIQKNRLVARTAAKKQADEMLAASSKRFSPLKYGDNVRIPIPDVDKGKTDHRNIMGVIMEVKNDFYVVGTAVGILKDSFARNQLVPVTERFLSASDVPNVTVRSLRSVANQTSASGGQGHKHCNCKTGCSSKRCNCFSSGRVCNSRCHNSNTCSNKTNA